MARTFYQSLPEGRTWTLLTDDKKVGQLVYRDQDGEEALVPSIWYNQPIQWRIDYFRFCVQRDRRLAANWLTSKDTWGPRQAADLNKQADRLADQIAEMERTGQFPA